MSAWAENLAAPSVAWADVERRGPLAADEFFADYVAKNRPVVLSGALTGCAALSRWTPEYLREIAGKTTVKLKQGLAETGVAGLKTVTAKLADYLDELAVYETRLREGRAGPQHRPAYLHDVPLASLFANPAEDLAGFAPDYFPSFYGRDWWRFAQFFLGPSHSLTPLHVDCLLTHNLFFQVYGRKRFILLPHAQEHLCGRYQWRWFKADPENPDYAALPSYREASPAVCVVGPGDMLYMPPGMLHHVRSLDLAISFNVDWHTRASALRGVLALGRGMPAKNVYYNAVIALGLWAGLPAKAVLPWYRSYLNYVS